MRKGEGGALLLILGLVILVATFAVWYGITKKSTDATADTIKSTIACTQGAQAVIQTVGGKDSFAHCSPNPGCDDTDATKDLTGKPQNGKIWKNIGDLGCSDALSQDTGYCCVQLDLGVSDKMRLPCSNTGTLCDDAYFDVQTGKFLYSTGKECYECTIKDGICSLSPPKDSCDAFS